MEDINKFIEDFKDGVDKRKTNLTPDMINSLMYTSWTEILDIVYDEWYNY